MKANAVRLLMLTLCLATAFWTPAVSLAIEDCPADYCGDMRDLCENSGGTFTQTSIGICRVNGTNQPSFEGVCEYTNQPPWGDACYGV